MVAYLWWDAAKQIWQGFFFLFPWLHKIRTLSHVVLNLLFSVTVSATSEIMWQLNIANRRQGRLKLYLFQTYIIMFPFLFKGIIHF